MKIITATITCLITLSAFFCLSRNVNAQDLQFLWAKSIDKSYGPWGASTVIDASGNIFLAGSFYSHSTIVVGRDTLINNSSSFDIFIVKYDLLGNVLWARSISGDRHDYISSISTDATGNIFVTGVFVSYTISLGSITLTKIGGQDVENTFIAKYDQNGNVIWARSFGSPNGGSITNSKIVYDNGNIYVSGRTSYPGDILNIDVSITLSNNVTNGMFLVNLDSNGNVIWERDGVSGPFAKDNNGNFYFVESFWDDSLVLGGITLYRTGILTGYVVKTDENGNVLWAKNVGDSSYNAVTDIAVDDTGNAYIVGEFSSNSAPGSTILKVDNSGNFLWAKQIGGTNSGTGHSIVVNANKNIYITGGFSGTVDFDPGPGYYNLSSLGVSDPFVSKLDNSGNFLWAKQIGGTTGHSIVVDVNENIFMAGFFSDTVDFDPGPGIYNLTSTFVDIFVVKFGHDSSCTTLNISTQPTDQTITVGGTATFSVVAAGTPPYTYQWSKNGIDINGANSNSYTTPTLTLADNGNIYSCYITNCSGSYFITSDTVTLTVNSGCTTPTTQASNISFSSIGENQMTVNWTNGNGSKRIVKINTSNSFTAPANGTDPTANSVYGGGEQVAYNNNGNSVTITGLTSSTTYWFRVYEANCSGIISLYNTSTATNNPRSQSTQSVVVPSWVGIYSNDLNHPFLGPTLLLDSAKITQTFPNEVKICADGSNVTVVKYANHDPSIPNSNIRFRINSGSDVNLNGQLDDYSYNGDTIIARFTHPKFVIPTILSFRPDNIDVVNNTNNSIIYQYPIKIFRAPVVFVHGLWGDYSTFKDMRDAFFLSVPLMHRVDYTWTNASNYFTNRNIVRLGIDAILGQARTEKFSAGKVIIIAHSMGGVLSRLYLQSTYTNPRYRSDIIKLITLNTPHFGSQLGNWLWDSHPNLIKKLNDIMTFSNGAFNNGDYTAISDLRVNSPATTDDLNIALALQNKVASTTIHTDATGDNSFLAKAVRVIIKKNGTTTYLFNGDENDLIVSNISQDGNLNLFNTLSGQWHVGSYANSSIINGCLELLDENPANSIFFTNNGFPPRSLSPPPAGSRFSITNEYVNKTTSDSINIITPASGQSFNPGDSVTVSLSTSGNISRTGLIVYGSSISPISIDTPNAVTILKFQIPTNAIGTLNIWVLGGDSTNWNTDDTTHILVNSSSIPDSIIADPDYINLPIGSTRSISVYGYFGGNPINLIGTQGLSFTYDTTYLIYKTGSVFQGRTAGSTDVIFNYGGQKDTVHFDVYDNPFALTASLNYSANSVCINSTIQFTDASIGIPVSYQWTFPGGTPSTSTQSNPVVSYSTPGYYPVILKTTFTNGVDSISIDSLIYVNQLPTATISAGGAITFCQNGSVTLTSNAASGNQWYKDAVAISDSTGTTLNVTASGSYTAKVTVNGCESASSNAIAVTVNSIPSQPGTISGVNTVCQNTSQTYSIAAVTGATSYTWTLPSGWTGSSTINSITTTAGASGGTITVKANNSCGSSSDQTLIVTVTPSITPTITISQASCTDNIVSFSSTVSNGGNAPSYLWTIEGTGTASDLTATTLTVNDASNGTKIYCKLTSSAACANSVQVTSDTLTINCIATTVLNIDGLEEFKIIPNPNNGLFNVRIKLNTMKDVSFRLFNSTGQIVYQSEVYNLTGTQLKEINGSKLSAGFYLLETTIGKESFAERVVITR